MGNRWRRRRASGERRKINKTVSGIEYLVSETVNY